MGWDLFDALLPWARGDNDGGEEDGAAGGDDPVLQVSNWDDESLPAWPALLPPTHITHPLTSPTHPFTRSLTQQLLRLALAHNSGREALMMIQGALSSHSSSPPPPHEDAMEEDEEEEDDDRGRGRGVHPSAVPFVVGQMADGTRLLYRVA